MATPMRMKDKPMNKIHLGGSGSMVIDVVQADAASASNGSAAQPVNPLSNLEKVGLPGGPSIPKDVVIEAAKDPNAQKEATTIAPNTGNGKVVAATEEVAPVNDKVAL